MPISALGPWTIAAAVNVAQHVAAQLASPLVDFQHVLSGTVEPSEADGEDGGTDLASALASGTNARSRSRDYQAQFLRTQFAGALQDFERDLATKLRGAGIDLDQPLQLTAQGGPETATGGAATVRAGGHLQLPEIEAVLAADRDLQAGLQRLVDLHHRIGELEEAGVDRPAGGRPAPLELSWPSGALRVATRHPA